MKICIVRSKALWLCLLLALCLLVQPGLVQAAPKRVALLIGNSAYAHERILPNPVRDVVLMEAVLVKLGFTVERLENQDKRGMELGINRFVTKTSGADTALLFYAGHGTQPHKGGRSFLLPVNADVKDDETLETDGVSAESIAYKLAHTSNPAKLRLVILDACRNRKNARGADRGLAPPPPTDNFTLIGYSTTDGHTADDGDGLHSPYALALSKQLPRAAREPIRRVFEDAAREVRKATSGSQNPRTYGDLESLIGLDGAPLDSIRPTPSGAQPTPLANGGMSLQDLEDEQATRKSWAQWQARMKTDFDKAIAFSGNAELQAKALERFVDAWGQDNPLSRDDDELRALALTSARLKRDQTNQDAKQRALQEQRRPGRIFKDCLDCPEMVVIPAGSFEMGSKYPYQKKDKPAPSVSVDRFAMGKYKVTRGQWNALMGSEPGNDPDCGGTCPAKVNWNDVQQFIQKLNQKTGQTYRLPSEAEWEYAARAGCKTDFGLSGKCLEFVGGTEGTGNEHTYRYTNLGVFKPIASVVGRFDPNSFGLHDMPGHVAEWVQDAWHKDYRSSHPTLWEVPGLGGEPSDHVVRYSNVANPAVFTFTERFAGDPKTGRYGFRLARAIP